MSNRPITVLLVDDHTPQRTLLRQRLERDGRFTLLAETSSYAVAQRVALGRRPTVIVTRFGFNAPRVADPLAGLRSLCPLAWIAAYVGNGDVAVDTAAFARGADVLMDDFVALDDLVVALAALADVPSPTAPVPGSSPAGPQVRRHVAHAVPRGLNGCSWSPKVFERSAAEDEQTPIDRSRSPKHRREGVPMKKRMPRAVAATAAVVAVAAAVGLSPANGKGKAVPAPPAAPPVAAAPIAFPGTLPAAPAGTVTATAFRTTLAPVAGPGLVDPSIPLAATPATLDVRFDGKRLKLAVASVDPKAFPAGCNVTFSYTGSPAVAPQTVALAAAVLPAVGNTASVVVPTTSVTNGVAWAAMTCNSLPTGKLKTVTISTAAFAGTAF